MSEKKISIIVPVYNVEAYLKRCIFSILSQSYRNLEIVLVDDGSSDGSGMICDQFAAKDKRVKVIHQKNQGLVVARKTGLAAAKGVYTGFVDGDDYIDENMYEALVTALERQQADFIHSGYIKDSGLCFGVRYENKYVLNKVQDREKLLKELVFDITNEQSLSPGIWSKLFRRELIIEAYRKVPDHQSYGEDLLCLCACIMNCKSFGVIPEAYYHYVSRKDSMCNVVNITTVVREMSLYESLTGYIKKCGVQINVKSQLDGFLLRGLCQQISAVTGNRIPKYKYPDISQLKDKRILLFGAGEVGQDYYMQITKYDTCVLAAWADTHYENYDFEYCRVISISEIRVQEYDLIVIAVLKEEIAGQIRKQLVKQGIRPEITIWKKPELIVHV